jgi:hypothetical protein
MKNFQWNRPEFVPFRRKLERKTTTTRTKRITGWPGETMGAQHFHRAWNANHGRITAMETFWHNFRHPIGLATSRDDVPQKNAVFPAMDIG